MSDWEEEERGTKIRVSGYAERAKGTRIDPREGGFAVHLCQGGKTSSHCGVLSVLASEITLLRTTTLI